jgi:rubrerythrin
MLTKHYSEGELMRCEVCGITVAVAEDWLCEECHGLRVSFWRKISGGN